MDNLNKCKQVSNDHNRLELLNINNIYSSILIKNFAIENNSNNPNISLLSFRVYFLYLDHNKISMKELDLRFPTCPIRNVLGRFADKWSLLILCNLRCNGTMRYKDIRNAIPDISQKMLSGTLKQLEHDRLLNRKAYAEIPPRVEYSLTEMGKSLLPIIDNMIEWAKVHFEEVTKN